MKKFLLIAVFASISPCLFAPANAGNSSNSRNISHTRNIQDSTQQFLLIIRSKANMPTPSPEALKTIGQHWGQFMGDLAQSGKLVIGYRPGIDGKTIAGNAKTAKTGVYAADKEVVSSILIIKAASLEEASLIAQKCPIYEMEGSVEIRPVTNVTH